MRLALVTTGGVVFNVLSIRTADDPKSALFPQLGGTPNTVEFEAADGSPRIYLASALRSVRRDRNGAESVLAVQKVDVSLFLTDCRVAVACSSYDKGGGWIGFGVGGLAVAAVANVVSRSRAASRTRGTALLGHVRYEWLRQVKGLDRSGLLGRNSVTLVLQEPAGATIALTITVDRSQSGVALATEVAQRAATYPAPRDCRRTAYQSDSVEYWLSAPTSPTPHGSTDENAQASRRSRQRSRLLLLHHP